MVCIKEHVFYVTADDVSIKNLTIKNSGNSDIEEFAGIYAEEVKNCNPLKTIRSFMQLMVFI